MSVPIQLAKISLNIKELPYPRTSRISFATLSTLVTDAHIALPHSTPTYAQSLLLNLYNHQSLQYYYSII